MMEADQTAIRSTSLITGFLIQKYVLLARSLLTIAGLVGTRTQRRLKTTTSKPFLTLWSVICFWFSTDPSGPLPRSSYVSSACRW